MKNLIKQAPFTILLILVIAISSCQCWEEPGIVASETRNMIEFTGVRINSIGKVNLCASEEFKITIKTHDDIMNDISVFVTDNVLEINLSGNHKRNKNP